MKTTSWGLLLNLFIIVSCNNNNGNKPHDVVIKDSTETYGYDRDFLKQHVDIVELSDGESKVLIVPKYQGRVMTSTCQGDSGFSFGWIDYALIDSGKYVPHINGYGGEDRFWMGPEGGQYSLFFQKGDPFDMEHWQTPAIIDTVTFDLVKKQANSASFTKSFEIQNYSGTKFNVTVNRDIELLDKNETEKVLDIKLPDIKLVNYKTINSIKNTANQDWNKDNGVLSIWLLSILKASPQTTVIIPFQKGGRDQVNDTYFGKVPAERLIIKDSVLFFKADAKFRSKIGIPPSIVKPIIGSYDAVRNILTIIKVDFKGDSSYVNSMWEHQKFPYKGDVINAYNDGPNDLGSQLGAFYEMETSSPAVALKKNESLMHTKHIFHFMGSKPELNKICQKLIGVDLNNL